MGGISPYMSVTRPSPVGIGLKKDIWEEICGRSYWPALRGIENSKVPIKISNIAAVSFV